MPDALLDMIDRFAGIGGTPGGGVRRLTGSAEDGAARRLFAQEAEQRGAVVHVDPVGNMFATFATAPAADTTVLVGSHLDSQPTGGRFDGAYGVLAGLDAAAALAAEGGLVTVLLLAEAVEAGLRAYDGALLVVSHDEAFLQAIGVTRRIALGA